MSETTAKATPEVILRQRLMDSCVPKSELEWFAKREIESLTAALTQSQAELAEVIAIRELAIQFYILGNPEKLIEYITENIDLGKYLEPTHE